MGFLDGISNSLKKLTKTEEVENKDAQQVASEQENPEEIDVFGQDINEDGVGDKISLKQDNLQSGEDGYYVEVDSTHNNSLYAIMSNTYEGWHDMSDKERAALVDIVMDANPEIYGKMVNDESGQYFSESDRQSLSNDSTLREERLNTIIYAGDKINIPTINPKIKEDSVKITQAAQSNDPEEHVHVGTVIATPHGTQEFVYTPNSDTAKLSEDGSTNFMDIIKEHFDENADDKKAYAIALDQAKANSDVVLEKINMYKEQRDMPNYAILVHSLKSDSKYLGFMKLAELAYNHEMASKENNQAFVDENYNELMDEAMRIYNVVKKYVGEGKDEWIVIKN